MTPATVQKRAQLRAFIAQVLAPHPAVQAVVGIGSLANGRMRPDSDIDAIIFLDPYSDYVVPAEALWRASDDSFHSIFVDDPDLQAHGLPLDFARLDWRQWSQPDFAWPEGRLAELGGGWPAYDRTGAVTAEIERRTAYPDALRTARLDEAVTWLDQHLSEDGPRVRWESLGPLIAHDRIVAAYHYLAQAHFALNRRWRPWRNREMDALLRLDWLPPDFAARVTAVLAPPAADYHGYQVRVAALQGLLADLLDKLQAEGVYGDDPIGEAFVRGADEPGRAWNMTAWNARRER